MSWMYTRVSTSQTITATAKMQLFNYNNILEGKKKMFHQERFIIILYNVD